MKEITTLTKSITSLITTIRQEILTGKQRIETTLENEKTLTYWKIGKHIHQHLLDYSDHTDYGDYLFKTLANELQISIRLLYRTVQFYETYPQIVEPVPQLTWSHYRILLTVKDEKKRKEYEQLVIKLHLSRRELQELRLIA